MIPGVVSGVFGVPLGHQQITLSGSAQFLPSIPAGATMVLISPVTASIQYRDDGTPPTSTTGITIAAGSYFVYGGDLVAFQLIGTSADKVNVAYYG